MSPFDIVFQTFMSHQVALSFFFVSNVVTEMKNFNTNVAEASISLHTRVVSEKKRVWWFINEESRAYVKKQYHGV